MNVFKMSFSITLGMAAITMPLAHDDRIDHPEKESVENDRSQHHHL